MLSIKLELRVLYECVNQTAKSVKTKEYYYNVIKNLKYGKICGIL